jgi:hypothetical protein
VSTAIKEVWGRWVGGGAVLRHLDRGQCRRVGSEGGRKKRKARPEAAGRARSKAARRVEAGGGAACVR